MLQHQLSSFQLEEKTEKTAKHIVVLITSFLAADIVKHKIGQRKWSDKHLLLSITPSELLTLQTLFSHHGRV